MENIRLLLCGALLLSAPLAAHAADNAAILVSEVNLSPVAPRTNGLLKVGARVSDAQGNPLAPATWALSYVWKRNGTIIPGQTAAALDLSETGNGDKGDQITVSVTATLKQSGLSSEARASDAVTIVNSAPTIVSSYVTTAPGRAVISRAPTRDADGDALTFRVSQLSGGQVGADFEPDGLFLYTPGDVPAAASFMLTVSDGTASASAPQFIDVAPAEAGAPLIYAALGASDVQGMGASDYGLTTSGQSAANSYAPLLLAKENAMFGAGAFALSRRSVNGFTVADALRTVGGTSMLELAVADAPRVVTIWYGLNDVTRFAYLNPDPTPQQAREFAAQFGRDCATVVGALKGSGRAVAIANMPRLGDSPYGNRYNPAAQSVFNELCEAVRLALAQVAADNGVPVVDLYNDARTVAPDYIAGQSLHPNDAGYANIAAKFWAALRPQLNRAPVGAAQNLSVRADLVLAGQLTATDADLDETAPPTFASARQPAHGSVAVNADGSFVYQAQADYMGEDSFGFVASDGTANGAEAVIRIEVSAAHRAPTLNDASYSTPVNAPFSQQLAGVAADGGALTYALAANVKLPVGLQLTRSGRIVGRPRVAGRTDFAVTASDGKGATATANCTIFVLAERDTSAPYIRTSVVGASVVGTSVVGTSVVGTSVVGTSVVGTSVVASPLTRDELAQSSLRGAIRDVAARGVVPSGVKNLLVQLRDSRGHAYSGARNGFTPDLQRGYYAATLGAPRNGRPSDPLAFARALQWIPRNLTPGDYTLNLVGQDVAGNTRIEVVRIEIVPPASSAPRAPVASGNANASGSGGNS